MATLQEEGGPPPKSGQNAEIEDAPHTPKEYEKALRGGEGRFQKQVQPWLEKTRKGTGLRFP